MRNPGENLMRKTVLALTLTAMGALALAAANRPLAARSAAQFTARATPITVALVDTLPRLRRTYAVVILRLGGDEPADIVLLPKATASGVLLDGATRALLHARAQQGDSPTVFHGRHFDTIMLGVNPGQAPTSWVQKEVPRAQHLVDLLPSAPTRYVPGVGTVHALDFYPPKLVK